MSDTQKKQFICPMKCEGTKTYDQHGTCPKCKMQLVPEFSGHKHGDHGK